MSRRKAPRIPGNSQWVCYRGKVCACEAGPRDDLFTRYSCNCVAHKGRCRSCGAQMKLIDGDDGATLDGPAALAALLLVLLAFVGCGGAAFGVGEQLEARVDAGDDVAELEAAADVVDAQVQQLDAPATDVVLLEASAVDAGLEASMHESGPSGCAGSPGPGKWWVSSLPSGSCVAVGAPPTPAAYGCAEILAVWNCGEWLGAGAVEVSCGPDPLEPSALQVDCEGP